MPFEDTSKRFESVSFKLPFDSTTFGVAQLPNSAVSVDEVTGYWVENKLFPELHIDGPWRPESEKLWRQVGNPSLAFWPVEGESLDFLEGLDDKLRSLRLIGSGYDISPVQNLTELRFLILGDNSNSKLDFSHLRKLRSLSMEWQEHDGLDHLQELESLSVYGSSHPDNLDYLSNFLKLRWLTISDARKVANLKPIEELLELRWLSLYELPGVKNLWDFSSNSQLQWLELEGLKKAELDFDDLESLKHLEKIRIYRTRTKNLERLIDMPWVREVGIDLKTRDLEPNGKLSWLADRFVGQIEE